MEVVSEILDWIIFFGCIGFVVYLAMDAYKQLK